MAFHRGPHIATDGLVLALDAASTRSYPGSGTTWSDLSGTGNDMTAYGTPSITTLGGSTCFDFNSDGDRFTGSISGLPTETITLEAWIYPAASEVTTGDRGTIILLSGGSGCYMSWNKSNRELSNYWYNKNLQGYHEAGPSCDRSRWHHWASVWTSSDLRQFVNGDKYTVNGISGTTTQNNSIIIGRQNSSRQFSGGIAVIRIYNRALTDNEVLQNYNATKGRFGL